MRLRANRLNTFLLFLALTLPGWGQEDAVTNATPKVETLPTAQAEPPAPEKSGLAKFNDAFGNLLFFDVAKGSIQIDAVDRDGKPMINQETGKQDVKTIALPFLVLILFFGALFFTIWFKFINIRGFRHSIAVIAGKYDNPDDPGEISHFKALTSALSATIGLGNIAGVAIAIQLGGPGAVFWMLLVALLGMSAKFSSCTLAQMYRKVNSDGSISGGPMYYLDLGLKEKGPAFAFIGKILAVMFAFMVMGGALGGGNMFQSNQTAEQIRNAFSVSEANAGMINHGVGVVMAILVGLVILGGIKRIGSATSKIVPAMCGLYVVASMIIIVANFTQIPASIKLIFTMAFSANAAYGGFVGVLVWGIKRASFSNEAGLGSAAIAHAAAKTDEPVREGMVAMIGPFIDTIVVCFMTAMVVIVTGAWADPALDGSAGVALTSHAFATVLPWFPYVLTICIALFAYSTMISWCYYGERGWIYLLDHFNGAGLKTVIVFRVIFVIAIWYGAVRTLEDVLAFSDLMILSMAFPNIIGSVMLAPKVKARMDDYWGRYKAGNMKTYK
ncbi:MAG: AGCS family alanine or glycine:cation symporter [Kiritimatiellia bacterium]|jgi:alanine or glycine:cation symporter, AGCS family